MSLGQIEELVRGISKDEMATGMFMILVPAHKNFPFIDAAQVKEAFENFIFEGDND